MQPGSWTLLLLPLAALLAPCRADALGDAISELPECMIQCVAALVSQTPCHSLANTTCLCASVVNLYSDLQSCLSPTCTGMDTITVARVQNEFCKLPQRSRKIDETIIAPLGAIAMLCILLRLLSRFLVKIPYQADDYIMMVVAPFYLVFVVLGQYAAHLAFGVDIWNVPAEDVTKASKMLFILESVYLAILGLTKLSMLCFYVRIFPQPSFRRVLFVIMGLMAATTAACVLAQLFQCLPVSYNWEGWTGTYGPHTCIDINVLAYAAGASSIAQDIAVLALPMPMVLSLKVSLRSKACLVLVFSMGIFILLTSCVRMRYLVLFARSGNPTWDYVDTLLWSGIEGAVSVIVTSLPAMRALLMHRRFGLFGTTARATAGGRTVSIHGGIPQPAPGKSGDVPGLELGDRLRGAVHTEISVGDDELHAPPGTAGSHRSQHSAGSHRSQHSAGVSGIHVLQTTTMTIERVEIG